jgi:hypothetical protein
MPEAPSPAFRIGELAHQLETDPHHWDQDQLGNAFPNLDSESFGPPIPARNQELPLVIRVDETHKIAEDYAVPVTEP